MFTDVQHVILLFLTEHIHVHQLEMAIYCRQLSQQSEGCRTTFKPHSEFLLVPEVLELPCRAAAATCILHCFLLIVGYDFPIWYISQGDKRCGGGDGVEVLNASKNSLSSILEVAGLVNLRALILNSTSTLLLSPFWHWSLHNIWQSNIEQCINYNHTEHWCCSTFLLLMYEREGDALCVQQPCVPHNDSTSLVSDHQIAF